MGSRYIPQKDFVAWYEYIYVSSYRPGDGHVIDRNMQSTNKDNKDIRFNKILLCLTAILTNSNHQHNGMEGTRFMEKDSEIRPCT